MPRTLGGSPLITRFLETTLPAANVAETPLGTDGVLQVISEAVSLLGLPVGLLLSRRAVAAAVRSGASAQRPAFVRFFFGGWGFDWLYDRLIVRPFVFLWELDQRDVADRIADGVGGLSMLLSRALRWTQNGRVRWYAAGVAAGAALVIAAAVLL